MLSQGMIDELYDVFMKNLEEIVRIADKYGEDRHDTAEIFYTALAALTKDSKTQRDMLENMEVGTRLVLHK